MPYLTAPITKEGPLVDLEVGLSVPQVQALRAAGRPVPQPIVLRGLIDTGADVTAIDPSRLRPLGPAQLPAFALVTDPFSGATAFAVQYSVSLTLVHPSGNRRLNWVLPALTIIEKRFAPHLGYEALVGQDVLARCLFVQDGQGKVFTLAY